MQHTPNQPLPYEWDQAKIKEASKNYNKEGK